MEKHAKSQENWVVIGDIHGRSSWKEIVALEPDAKGFVFVGDYFDSRDRIAGAKQLENFLEIVAFKHHKETTTTQQVILLFGNHDFHYMPWFTRDPYSGYLPYMAKKYQKALVNHLSSMQMSHAIGDVLMSHAGISVTWLERFMIPAYANISWADQSASFIASAVNDTFIQSPKSFDFNGFNPFGDDPQQSPIWIRPVALKMANYNMLHKDLIQVFGHTVSRDPQETFERSLNDPLGHYFHADMLEKRCYLKFNGNDFQLAQFVK